MEYITTTRHDCTELTLARALIHNHAAKTRKHYRHANTQELSSNDPPVASMVADKPCGHMCYVTAPNNLIRWRSQNSIRIPAFCKSLSLFQAAYG